MKCFQVLDLFFALQTIASRLDSGIAAHRQFLIHKADQVVVIIVTIIKNPIIGKNINIQRDIDKYTIALL